MTTRGTRILVFTLLALGVGAFAFVERHPSVSRDLGPRRTGKWVHAAVLIGAIALAAMPTTRGPIARVLDRVRKPTPDARRKTAAIIFVVAIAYIPITARLQGRDLIPKFHDEHLLLVQTRMLAHGKLWTAPHPLADFFETYHVFVKPVYASVYFPGTALLYVPSIWLGLKFYMMPLLVAGACCALLYRVTAELLDGVAGLLAALMLLSLQWFRYLALMEMSQPVMVLLGLAMMWSYLRWRRDRAIRWGVAIGAFAGWAAITRPVDALCFAVPIGIAMLLDLRGLPLRRALTTIGVACVFAILFLSLQVIENIGVTGNPLRTPYRLYVDRFTPQMSFGFHRFDPSVRPQTTLLQRQIYYDQFTVPAAREHTLARLVPTWLYDRFPLLAEVTLPNRALLVLLPLSGLALTVGSRRVVWAVLLLYLAFYALFAYLLPMYCVVIAPVVIVWALLGVHAIERFVSDRLRDAVTVGLTLAVAGLSIAALPEIDRDVIDDGYLAPTMWFSYVELPKLVKPPAIVLFRFRPGDNVNEEPVYTIDAVNPDDSPIIRAHDLGLERNRELFDYYARRQPERTVYLYDRAGRNLVLLGNVVDLARRFPVTRPSGF